MWPRAVEVMLAIWLLMSPFVFRYTGEQRWLWVATLGAAALVFTFSLAAFKRSLSRLFIGTLVTGTALAVGAYFVPGAQTSPALQNLIVTGICLGMIGILPGEATAPPRKWREYHRRGAE